MLEIVLEKLLNVGKCEGFARLCVRRVQIFLKAPKGVFCALLRIEHQLVCRAALERAVGTRGALEGMLESRDARVVELHGHGAARKSGPGWYKCKKEKTTFSHFPPPRFAPMWSDTSWTPPEKFGCVERGLYRSAFPTTASHEYLKLLGLRTVVNLSQELPMRAVISGFEDLGAELINLGLAVWTRPDQPPISHELIKEALQLVLDVQRQPVLMISASGTHEVGTLVGCLRRLQVCVCVCVCVL